METRDKTAGNSPLGNGVARRPTTPDELLDISGVGKKKLKRYGEKFLALLRRSAD